MALKMGTCPKCNVDGPITVHHIYPKRFYGGRGPLVKICRTCHDELERYIPLNEKMPDDFYPMIVRWFCAKED